MQLLAKKIYRTNWNRLSRALMLVVAAAFLVAGCSPAGTTQAPTQPANPGGGEASYPEVQRISLEDAKSAFDAGEALFVDVRSKSAYDISHIAGAVSIPLDEMEARIGELDPNQWIITYCT